jgi:glycosyltransferase involved in cell wall biosynthesis
VDLEHFQPRDRVMARHDLGIPEDASVFVCVALFAPVKGHSVLVEAFRQVTSRRDGVQLVLIGDGAVRPAIEEQVRSAGIEDRVRFTGNVDHRLVPKWLAASDAFVLPSFNEGTPLSALEALAAGRPVVGTAVGGTQEVVCDEDLGLIVAPGDPTALAQAMESALERSWNPDRLRNRARDFAWPKLTADIFATYVALITGK